jgi:hypothetical protein
MFAVNVSQGRYAGRYALIPYPVIFTQGAYQYRTGPAIAFATADLGTCKPLFVPYKIQEGHPRIVGGLYGFII